MLERQHLPKSEDLSGATPDKSGGSHVVRESPQGDKQGRQHSAHAGGGQINRGAVSRLINTYLVILPSLYLNEQIIKLIQGGYALCSPDRPGYFRT